MGLLKNALHLVTRSDTGAQDPTPIESSAPVPPPRSAYITPESSLALESVYRAVSILQAAAQQISLDSWRGIQKVDPAPSLVTRPAACMARSEFIAETVMSLALRGNAYWRIWRNEAQEIINLEPLDPALVLVSMTKPGRYKYHYQGQELTRSKIAHMKLLRVPGRPEGLGPIQAARELLTGALAVRNYADNWINSGGVPNGVLSTEQALTAQMASNYKNQWMESQSYDKGPAVLGSGLKYSPLALKPEELQWLESQKFSVTQVARLFGIPAAHMLAAVEGSSMTYANIEQMEISFIRYTLMGYLRPIEEAFTDILPRGQTARFNLDSLLRTDTAQRYNSYATAIQAGFVTIDEVRSIENLPPMNGENSEEESVQQPA